MSCPNVLIGHPPIILNSVEDQWGNEMNNVTYLHVMPECLNRAFTHNTEFR